MRIAVIGYSGAGKSTLARALGELYSCPVLHLDTVQFTPGWRERDRKEARKMVRVFMKENPAWVIDGNYRSFYEARRMDEADRIVFLNFPRSVCLLQAFFRYLRYRGRTRETMAAGCPEKFDLEFTKWILWDGRNRERRMHYRRICRKYREKTAVCRNRRQVRMLLKRWGDGREQGR